MMRHRVGGAVHWDRIIAWLVVFLFALGGLLFVTLAVALATYT